MRSVRLLAALALAPWSASAQSAMIAHAELRAGAGGSVLASLRPGAVVSTSAARGGSTLIAIDGYVAVSALGGKRDTFKLSVKEPSGAILRKSPDRGAPIFAVLRDGIGLQEMSRTGEWVRVRRSGWVPSKTFSTAAPAAASSASTAKTAAAPPPVANKVTVALPSPAAAPATAPHRPPAADLAPALTERDMVSGRRTALAAAPGAGTVATLLPGARVHALLRDRGWVKVQMEGWVREGDLLPADPSVRTGVSAADLRADPVAVKGKSVRWQVQIIAFQLADALRPDLGPDEPYLLARGPGGENALLYLALPKSLVEMGRAMASSPLANVIVTARVRTGRSEPTGVPILDVLTLAKP